MQLALRESIASIIDGVKKTLRTNTSRIICRCYGTWNLLTGGGALLKNLDKVISDETNMPVFIAENPLDCVAIGTGKALDHIEIDS